MLLQSIPGTTLLDVGRGIISLVPLSLLLLTISVVVSGVPVWIELHVFLSLLPGLLIILGLLLSRQSMPPPPQDLIDGRRLLQRTLSLHYGSHLSHVQHEGIQRLLDMVLLLGSNVLLVIH